MFNSFNCFWVLNLYIQAIKVSLIFVYIFFSTKLKSMFYRSQDSSSQTHCRTSTLDIEIIPSSHHFPWYFMLPHQTKDTAKLPSFILLSFIFFSASPGNQKKMLLQ